MAIGIVSFGLLSVAGLLPVALKTVKDSAVEVSMANIAQQVRSELVQASFDGISSNFGGKIFFYSAEGVKTNETGAYFSAKFEVNSPVAPGASVNYVNNAKSVKVAVSYPFGVPAAGQQTNTFAILAAKQMAGSW